mmetsp:Transcript_11928/g.17992  ORF Transcript_11928/g.17992 Transcript_11928/m.17992 type:complete len:107 (+) Transcript_11928:67-387(+)
MTHAGINFFSLSLSNRFSIPSCFQGPKEQQSKSNSSIQSRSCLKHHLYDRIAVDLAIERFLENVLSMKVYLDEEEDVAIISGVRRIEKSRRMYVVIMKNRRALWYV